MTKTQLTGKVSKDNIIAACNEGFKILAARRANLREYAIHALMETEKKWDWKIFRKRPLTYAEAEEYYDFEVREQDNLIDTIQQINVLQDEDTLRSIYWIAMSPKIYDITLTESQLHLLRPFL